MAKIPDEIVKTLKDFRANIQSDIQVKKIILFGSYAKGNFSANSDVDVCIITEQSKNNYLTLLKIIPKIIDIDLRIEPVVFSEKEFNASAVFGLLKEIKTYGIEI